MEIEIFMGIKGYTGVCGVILDVVRVFWILGRGCESVFKEGSG